MTDSQRRFLYIVATILSGPAIALAARYTHMGTDDIKLWTDLLAALTTAAGVAWGITSFSPSAVVHDAANVDGVQVHVDTRTASPAVAALANDKANNKDIVPMSGPNGIPVPVLKGGS